MYRQSHNPFSPSLHPPAPHLKYGLAPAQVSLKQGVIMLQSNDLLLEALQVLDLLLGVLVPRETSILLDEGCHLLAGLGRLCAKSVLLLLVQGELLFEVAEAHLCVCKHVDVRMCMWMCEFRCREWRSGSQVLE